MNDARHLLRTRHRGALATIGATGGPFVSLVGVASSPSGEPLLLLSRLARHTRNLDGDDRAALLLAEDDAGDPLASARLTVEGRVLPAADPGLRRRYLAVHPGAGAFADFADFGLYRLAVESAHSVAGFGRILSLSADELVLAPAAWAALAAAEERICEHMNADHAEAANLYATRLLGQKPGPWRLAAIDPDGADLRNADTVVRLAFPRLVTTATDARDVLVDLVAAARRETETRA